MAPYEISVRRHSGRENVAETLEGRLLLLMYIYIYIYMAEASFSARVFGFLQGKNSIF